LLLETFQVDGKEIEQGLLSCSACHGLYPIVDGIPDMLPNSILEATEFCKSYQASLARHNFKPDPREVRRFEKLHKKTARAFGYEWNKYQVTSPEEDLLTLCTLTGFDPGVYKKIFFSDIFSYMPTKEEVEQINTRFLAGKTVIELGCGMGKYVKTVARYAAVAVGLDLSHALLRARRDSAGYDNIFYVRGNILEPPFRPQTFDYGYSVGVLHHTPDCHQAFNQSLALVKEGGKFSVWLYPTERETSFYSRLVRFVQDGLMRPITCRLPPPLLYQMCKILGRMTFWRDAAARKGHQRLTQLLALFAVGAHPVREIAEFLNFDWYSPQYRSYHSEDELLAWFSENRCKNITILPQRTSAIAEKPRQNEPVPALPPPRVIGSVDYPAVAVCESGSRLLVQGWAFETAGRSCLIKAFVNGRCVKTLQCFSPRVDVKKHYPDVLHALYCGFQHWLDVKRSWAPGVELTITAEVPGSAPVTLFRKNIQVARQPVATMIRRKVAQSPIGPIARPIVRRCRSLMQSARRRVSEAPLPALPSPVSPPSAHEIYQRWLTQNPDDKPRRIEVGKDGPVFSILLPVHNTPRQFLSELLQSIAGQTYPNWQLCAVDDGSKTEEPFSLLKQFAAKHSRVSLKRLSTCQGIGVATNEALAMARGDYVCFVDHDDVLNVNALAVLAETLGQHPDADVLYGDHDLLLSDGTRDDPRLKPSWSPELLLSFMYWGHLKTYRRQLVVEAGGLRPEFRGGEDYDLALRLSEKTDRIIHMPAVLYHWRKHPLSTASGGGQKDYSIRSGLKALQEHVDRRGIPATVVLPEHCARAGIGLFKLQFHFESYPLVTIIIPTRDRLELLRKCIATLEQVTTYPNYEIVIVDNGSREEATLEYLRRSKHRVISRALHGEFNFSALVNEGAKAAHGESLLLLNNDIEVIQPDWLHELVGYTRIPGVGAVGATLLYPDGRIQHNGVVLGHEALTGHYFQGEANYPHDLGFLSYKIAVRNVAAVTGACLLTPRALFEQSGGFDQTNLRVAWNDVDYCLRLLTRGYRVVINPHALLVHHEGLSRGDAKNEAEVYYMLRNWRDLIKNDPYYHPFFSRTGRNFSLRLDPREEEALFYYKYHRQLSNADQDKPAAGAGKQAAA
jgi:GT2 family glycosyltransferase/SAM-dependent methyltransferase/uncharacterized protein YbaR (Trm112 family)